MNKKPSQIPLALFVLLLLGLLLVVMMLAAHDSGAVNAAGTTTYEAVSATTSPPSGWASVAPNLQRAYDEERNVACYRYKPPLRNTIDLDCVSLSPIQGR